MQKVYYLMQPFCKVLLKHFFYAQHTVYFTGYMQYTVAPKSTVFGHFRALR